MVSLGLGDPNLIYAGEGEVVEKAINDKFEEALSNAEKFLKEQAKKDSERKKSEEENIMEEAIGAKIADYLIKPVNPNQILLSLKKNLDASKLVTEKTISTYQQSFRQLSTALVQAESLTSWSEVYQKILYWEMEIDNIDSPELKEIFNYQKTEANNAFSRFIAVSYTHLTLPTKRIV